MVNIYLAKILCLGHMISASNFFSVFSGTMQEIIVLENFFTKNFRRRNTHKDDLEDIFTYSSFQCVLFHYEREK